jgi:hypothetical protein
MNPPEADTLQRQGYNCQLVREFVQFYVTKLDMEFVNNKTRGRAVGRRWLVLVGMGREDGR